MPKVGFVEPVYKDSLIAFNPRLRQVFQRRRKYLPVWDTPNLALLTLAALVPSDWEVKYIHSYVDEIDYDEAFDIIALSGITRQANDMYAISERFRENGVYTIIGGIHATVLPDEAIHHADTVVVGEAERLFPQFLEDFTHNKAARVYSSQERVDIRKSPIPRFDLLEKKYLNYPIQTTRGCPHDCKFCAGTRIYGKRYRHKDVEQVVEEIKSLKSVHDSPFVIFADDNMFANKSFSYALAEALIPLRVKWQAQTDISVGEDRNLLRLLYKAGCKELYIGFESMNPENIKDINSSQWKSKKVAIYQSMVAAIQQSGIRVFGAFILGFDKDTKADFDKVMDFVAENRILGNFTILTPLPGTQLYEEFKESERLLENKPWKYYNFADCVIKHPNFTADELEEAAANLYRTTYSQEHYARVLRNLVETQKKLDAANRKTCAYEL